MDNLPKQTRPYYIFAPSYTSKSAGVVTLYNLCHFLNKAGQKAFIVHMADQNQIVNPWLDTPILSVHEERFFINEGIDPVHVYPDIVNGNPCNAKIVARFLLHYPGVYGGSETFPDTDHVWSFSPHIASYTTKPDNVMSCANLNLDLFKNIGAERSGSCFYANKYLSAGNSLLPVTDGMTKLEGTHEQVAAILQRSEVCYVYENTSVISEAVLCGCPVVLIRSEFFKEVHSLDTQTGHAGVKWMDEADYHEPVDKALDNYYGMCNRFFTEQLPRFVAETQKG